MSFTPTPRVDIPVEIYDLLDGSGDYTTAWLETASVFDVRVCVAGNGGSPTITVEDGMYNAPGGTVDTVRAQGVPWLSATDTAFAEFGLSARYYRVVIVGGNANNPIHITVRSV